MSTADELSRPRSADDETMARLDRFLSASKRKDEPDDAPRYSRSLLISACILSVAGSVLAVVSILVVCAPDCMLSQFISRACEILP